MTTQMYKGSLGKHDWAIGDRCGDGYLVFVDDRPLSYRNTLEEAIGLSFHIIARLKAAGDYRLNDKPAGFSPPEFKTLRVGYHSLVELYALWDVFRNVKTSEYGVYIDAPFLYFRKGTAVRDIERWFEGRNSRFNVDDVKKGNHLLDAAQLEADFDLTVFGREESAAEKKPLIMPISLVGKILISKDKFGDVRAGLSINDGVFFTGQTTERSAYSLTQEEVDFVVDLNALIEEATQAALNAGCLTVQEAVGVDSGDLAGVFFSGSVNKEAIAHKFAEYILAELTEKATAD
ncbi:hypothetical protein A9R05_42775 (plasmid) [Burkholderia sp. KK1]|uniref:Uncharacterized protein n=1 Tax=Burkholderia sp. M701 TaxID=326454 RepID=V5YP05_9BURK|nr:hypothetical protein [Burkholderia sp. M701]AQH05744.1 hypothetical protein A9R05_42775 [Burkholderia sp. KK1]BAO18979.1 hypothetical protein [Burkholderia sp. M701]